ncbi:hypothetical protein [Streptomyces sp. NPDC055912]|uniref:hypothetical protein n=1 Tax=Streptomyces sp. NPDC055912 TaxID=3345660 RepID=UPI0035D8C733
MVFTVLVLLGSCGVTLSGVLHLVEAYRQGRGRPEKLQGLALVCAGVALAAPSLWSCALAGCAVLVSIRAQERAR